MAWKILHYKLIRFLRLSFMALSLSFVFTRSGQDNQAGSLERFYISPDGFLRQQLLSTLLSFLDSFLHHYLPLLGALLLLAPVVLWDWLYGIFGMPIQDPENNLWIVVIPSLSGFASGVLTPLILAWWNKRKEDQETNLKIHTAAESDDREDASLYVQFRKDMIDMESRLSDKHEKEIVASEEKYNKRFNEINAQLARTNAAVDFLCEHVDPAIAKVARQIQLGQWRRGDVTEEHS